MTTEKETSGSRHTKQNGYKSDKLWARREKRRMEAEARQETHNKLTLAQKLAKAKGNRERTRLEKLVIESKKAKPAPAPEASKPVKQPEKRPRYKKGSHPVKPTVVANPPPASQ